MTATIIDGTQIAKTIKEQIAHRIQERNRTGLQTPGLATVLVGDDPASRIYVRNKIRTCEALGIRSVSHSLPADTTQRTLEELIDYLNTDPKIHGILVQLPLPDQIDEYRILSLLNPQKDVDGFHPINAGMLSRKESEPWFIPCTPAGILRLIHSVRSDITGLNAVVIGRSSIVGMPTAQLLSRHNATVTIAHSYTVDLPSIAKRADILVAAAGVPKLVTADWVKPGAIVIDVGITRVDDPTSEKGYRIVGDTDFEAILPIASAVTPMPGGVGPMTIAMLMRNTLLAADRCAYQN